MAMRRGMMRCPACGGVSSFPVVRWGQGSCVTVARLARVSGWDALDLRFSCRPRNDPSGELERGGRG